MHYLYYFSYPASPIATIDLNMLPLFYGCCTNKFVVMQARYRPLSSFHFLLLPRSSDRYTLVTEDASQTVGNLLQIGMHVETWSQFEVKFRLDQRKTWYLFLCQNQVWPHHRVGSFCQAQPDMWSDRVGFVSGRVKPNLSQKFQPEPSLHIGWIGSGWVFLGGLGS